MPSPCYDIKDAGVSGTTDIELEQHERLIYAHGKDNESDEENSSKDISGLRLALHFVGIVLLSFSCFTTLHILLTPTAPSTEPWASKIFPELLYSPVEHLVGYKPQKFHTGFFDDEEPSVFDGPSTDAMDDAWTGLYDVYRYAISTLTEEENKRLPEPTVPSFGNMSRLYGGLDVFHQLHCLDYVRKAIEPERYGNSHHGRSSLARRRASKDLPHVSDTEHISHCIDMIRQSLMCSADISVISWYMPEASSPEHTPRPLPRFDQTRMCRDFDSLRDWARSRTPDAEGLEGVMPHGDHAHDHSHGHAKF
ncbi:ustYa family protein [Pleurotus pulmonarius]